MCTEISLLALEVFMVVIRRRHPGKTKFLKNNCCTKAQRHKEFKCNLCAFASFGK
jgi:hypothetical protein